MTSRDQYAMQPTSAAQFYQLWSANVDALERHLSAGTWAMAAIAVVLIVYPIARIGNPVLLHRMEPDVVRTVLNLI